MNPVVSGNKRLKVWHFWFVERKDSANRFAMKYNGQSVIFGKL